MKTSAIAHGDNLISLNSPIVAPPRNNEEDLSSNNQFVNMYSIFNYNIKFLSVQ